MPQLIIFGWFYVGSTVSAMLNSTGDSPGEQRHANVKLSTGLLPVDFTMFFFPSVVMLKTCSIYYYASVRKRYLLNDYRICLWNVHVCDMSVCVALSVLYKFCPISVTVKIKKSYVKFIKLLWGVQISFRRLIKVAVTSKFWLKLTYVKRHGRKVGHLSTT